MKKKVYILFKRTKIKIKLKPKNLSNNSFMFNNKTIT